MTAHTSGPWTVFINDNIWFRIRDAFESEAEANARLIAAAPDLLQVAEGCLGWLKALPWDYQPDPQWFKPLEAAIAKAVAP